MVWKVYRPRVRLVLAGAMLLRGYRLFGVALHWEPKGAKGHEHHILANRSICWSTYIVETDAGKRRTVSLPQ